ncbi:MAG: hypothetical protein CMH57_01735 [Myxococcales bacterium]|nr:hypothetical protein [Myxococcales bacterium]
MSRRTASEDLQLTLTTRIAVRELFNGDQTVYPVTEPNLVNYGGSDASLDELKAFLEEHLLQIEPEKLSNYALPEETWLLELDVPLVREELPRQIKARTLSVTIPCAVIPFGTATWVMILPLVHMLYVRPDEDLEQCVGDEVQRMIAAMELSPQEFLRLLPGQRAWLEPLDVDLNLLQRGPQGRHASLQRALAKKNKRKQARDVLESIATAVHDWPEAKKAPALIGRDVERKTLHGLLSGKERLSVLLVGAERCGKSALLLDWLRAERSDGRVRPVYATSGARLIAGMSIQGQWQARLRRVLEAAELLDAILYFDDLRDLLVERPGQGGADLAGAIKPFLDEGRVRLVGELTSEQVDRMEGRHVGFFSCLGRLRVQPLTAAQTTEAIQRRVEWLGRHAPHRPNLAMDAVEVLIDLTDRYMPYQAFPGKAVGLLEEARSLFDRERTAEGEPITIDKRRVYRVFSLKTGIPEFLLRDDHALKLDAIVANFRARLIGQDEAVRRVAETVCVVKAGLQPTGKPLAVFLFVGPTGVGKTEMARSLAAFLFGAADRMVRFDMSEFMDPGAAQRLIQGTDRAEGMLTREVRRQPFCVLLLDEIEKADPAVFDLLLQVCGEGRLTDARGRTAYFHNAIIIMTSNLGAAHHRPKVGLLASSDDGALQTYYVDQVNATFRPEFVNRLDRIIAFHKLTPEQVAEVSKVLLNAIQARQGLAEAGIQLKLSDAALAHLARGGYSEKYGARALRRHLDDTLVAPLAAALAAHSHRLRNATVLVTREGEPWPEEEGSRKLELTGWSRGGLTGVVLQGKATQARQELHGMAGIAEMRRRVDAWMAWDAVDEVRDRLEVIQAQLNYGRKGRGDRRASAQLAELQAEHHHLNTLWSEATSLRRAVYEMEELGMSALFDEEGLAPFVAEAREAYRRFQHHLIKMTLALRPKRDQITLLVQEPDPGRPMDRWLLPLLDLIDERGWSLRAHGHRVTPRSDETSWSNPWWGPSRDGSWLRSRLQEEERSFRQVLLRIKGSWAGVMLAFEAGLHRWSNFGGEHDPSHLLVHTLALRTDIKPAEWARHVEPPAFIEDAVLSIRKPERHTRRISRRAGDTLEILGGARSMKLEPDPGAHPYWGSWEDVVFEHLMALNARGERLDPLFSGLLDRVKKDDEDEDDTTG